MAHRELFVWYRVRRERADDAHRLVTALQRSLEARWSGLRARVLVRDDADPATWMETYARSAATPGVGEAEVGIDAAIEAAIAAAALPLAALIEGTRHVEAFEVRG